MVAFLFKRFDYFIGNSSNFDDFIQKFNKKFR